MLLLDSMDALGNFLVGFLGLCGWVGVGELVYTFYTLLQTHYYQL